MYSTILVAALLLAVALGTWWWQHVSWQSQQQGNLPRYEVDFYRRRNRRRTQISVLLALVAVAMLVGITLTQPLVVGLVWCGVVLVLLWILILACIDASSSHLFFDRQQARQLAEQAALQREFLARTLGTDPDRDPQAE